MGEVIRVETHGVSRTVFAYRRVVVAVWKLDAVQLLFVPLMDNFIG